MTNINELRAGTDPGSDTSVFAVDRVESIVTGRMAVLWHARPGKTYVVELTESVGGEWTPAGTVSATSEVASHEITPASPAALPCLMPVWIPGPPAGPWSILPENTGPKLSPSTK